MTEFGLSTNQTEGSAEAAKAADLTAEFTLLASQVAGPILWYTARTFPLTRAQWAAQCPGMACPGRVGGSGLFEWLDGGLTLEPAGAAFAKLP